MYGGTCINVGCIPSKSLVTSSLKLKGKDLNLDEKKKFFKQVANNTLEKMITKKN